MPRPASLRQRWAPHRAKMSAYSALPGPRPGRRWGASRSAPLVRRRDPLYQQAHPRGLERHLDGLRLALIADVRLRARRVLLLVVISRIGALLRPRARVAAARGGTTAAAVLSFTPPPARRWKEKVQAAEGSSQVAGLPLRGDFDSREAAVLLNSLGELLGSLRGVDCSLRCALPRNPRPLQPRLARLENLRLARGVSKIDSARRRATHS